MPRNFLSYSCLVLAVTAVYGDAVTVSDIQGVSFQSPLANQVVRDVSGIVTAKRTNDNLVSVTDSTLSVVLVPCTQCRAELPIFADKYGAWILGKPSGDPRTSNGLRIYGSSALKSVAVGDAISVTGRVSEYRPNYSPNDLYLTELVLPRDVKVHSRSNPVTPVVLGKDRIPPQGQLSALDSGPDGWLSIPNNVTRLESVNATLQPDLFGLDFWESLEGQLVSIPLPVAVNFPDRFGSIWVYGDWPVAGKNSRGGLSLTFSDSGGAPDAHSGAILIGRPLDNTRNPRTSMGTSLSDITGIVSYQYGTYYVLPLTAPTIVSVPEETTSGSSLISGAHPCDLTIGDYNVENMGPRSLHLSTIAEHIVNGLNAPDVMFVQEIQDDSGTRDDGTVSANKTLQALVKAIGKVSDGDVHYEFVNVEPENNMDGGQPGGNIRVAYIYRPEKVTLVAGSLPGNATQATQPIIDEDGKLSLSHNPGRIDPTNMAWDEARKPVAAVWQTSRGDRFYTVNVHLSSKRYSSSTGGDARPPVNGKSEQRTAQVEVISAFVRSLLAHDANASLIVGGDMNEFLQTRSVFASLSGLLHDINEAAGVPPAERYTYVYDQHSQEIDHIFVSPAVATRGADVEHVHVNTWARSAGERASDHDPSVARVCVCETDVGEEDAVLPLASTAGDPSEQIVL